MATNTNYAGVADNSGIAQSAVYDANTGLAVPMAAGVVATDANHNNQKSAPVQVQLPAPTAAFGHVILDANTIATYAASITGLVPVASATDIFTLTGSATKVIRITRLAVSCTTSAATGATLDLVLLVRSAANTGGASTAPTAVAYDSADPVATGTVLAYTGNPATGALVGNIYASKLQQSLATATSTDFPTQAPLVIQFGITDSKPVVLRGITQVFAVNLAAQSVAAGALWDIAIEWTEALV